MFLSDCINKVLFLPRVNNGKNVRTETKFRIKNPFEYICFNYLPLLSFGKKGFIFSYIKKNSYYSVVDKTLGIIMKCDTDNGTNHKRWAKEYDVCKSVLTLNNIQGSNQYKPTQKAMEMYIVQIQNIKYALPK
jgi:hypothetical protein